MTNHPFHSLVPATFRTAACVAVLLASAVTAQSAHTIIDYSLGGDQLTTRWDALNNTNPTFTPATGSGTLSVDGPAFPASIGLYSFSGDYGITVSQATGDLSEVNTVLLQIDAAPAGPVIPVLTFSFSGSTETLEPSFAGVTRLETRPTTAGDVVFQNLTFQWDLSGVPESITEVSIRSAIPAHTSTVAAQIDVSSSVHSSPVFSAVPEPSSALLATLTAASLLLHRNRAPRSTGAPRNRSQGAAL